MSEEQVDSPPATDSSAAPFNDNPTGVSPARKAVSGIILLLLLVVLGIELRAGYGHMTGGKALQAEAPEGVFARKKHTKETIEALLPLGPRVEEINQYVNETEYRYTWYSLLRPLFSRPEATLYVVFRSDEPHYATRYSVTPPAEKKPVVIPEQTEGSGMSGMEGFGDGRGLGGSRPGGSRPGDGERPGSIESPLELRRPPMDDDKPDESENPSKASDETSDETR